jgi:hypothetical protein
MNLLRIVHEHLSPISHTNDAQSVLLYERRQDVDGSNELPYVTFLSGRHQERADDRFTWPHPARDTID